MGQKTASFLAVLLVGLILGSSAYYVFLKPDSTESNENCNENERLVDGECVPDSQIDDDPSLPVEVECGILEIKEANECRPLMPPTSLDYGVSNVESIIGEHVHLIPSFDGDGPDEWTITPSLPQGLLLNNATGEINGTVQSIIPQTNYTVFASNAAGLTHINLTFHISDVPPGIVTYPSIINVFTKGIEIPVQSPTVEGGGVATTWSVVPALPDGLSLNASGVITGIPTELISCQDYVVNASNPSGSSQFMMTICVTDESPYGLSYPSTLNTFTVNTSISPLIPIVQGGDATMFIADPPLPEGLILNATTGVITGQSSVIHSSSTHLIWANNSGGSTSTLIELQINDVPVSMLTYGDSNFSYVWNADTVTLLPTWSGGAPVSWTINPVLPAGITFSNGQISGLASTTLPPTTFTVWANNSGGSTSTTFIMSIVDQTPRNISWGNATSVAFGVHNDVQLNVTNNGPQITSWEIEPPLPSGLSIATSGDIQGTPLQRTPWQTYQIWANNSGGSFTTTLELAVHDVDADWQDITAGVGTVNYGSSLPSLILPLGEWSFPVALDWDDRPIVSASHTGLGRMVGYGHESMVGKQGGSNETTLSLNAIQWACGGVNKVVGVQVDYDHFEDELQAEGFTVISNAWPSDLTGMDCFMGEFWNSYSDAENAGLEAFMLSGGGVVLGGHSWYWSYSNDDVAHDYSGNKIIDATGLYVSSSTGSAASDLQGSPPSTFNQLRPALEGLEAYMVNNEPMNNNDQVTASKMLERVVSQIPLDFTFVWQPLRAMTNGTGWIEISPEKTFDLQDDAIDRLVLKIQDRLLSLLPPSQLTAHPSSVTFPGEVPPNAARVTQTVTVNGTFAGLPSQFGYAGARADGRMSTGLYAAAGDVVNVSVPQNIVNSGVNILVGAHTDKLWNKNTLSRHPVIFRTFDADKPQFTIGNAFGGAIYVRIPAGSTLGEFDVTIENAVPAPYWKQGETSLSLWNSTLRHHPAPWAEIESDQFILSVPSSDIRDLDTPNATMEFWDLALEMEHNLSGYTPWPRVERAVFDVQISVGWMHSGYPFMAHTASSAGVLNSTQMWNQGDWGMFHELGHNHQWMPSTLPGTTEATCNLYSVKLMTELVGVNLGTGHQAMNTQNRESRTETYFQGGSQISSWSVWTALETYIQVQEEFGWEPITEALAAYYTMSDPPNNDEQEFNRWVVELSKTTGYNLAPYHEAWGFPLTQQTKDSLLHLPVWVDDPLRGWVYEYDPILLNLTATNIASTTADIEWDVYDNGTDTNLTLCYGQNNGGNSRSAWSTCTSVGTSTVGHYLSSLSGLTSSTTYYVRLVGDNSNGDTWSDIYSFVTA